MLIMYVTGEYSYSQIAAFFNMHFIAVGKIVRGAKENSGKRASSLVERCEGFEYRP